MLKRSIRIFLLLALASLAILLAFTLWKGLDGTIDLLASFIKGQHAVDRLKEALTPVRFNLLRGGLVLLMIAVALLWRASDKVSAWIGETTSELRALLSGTWKTLAQGPGKWILLLPLAVTVYGMLFIPVNFDEALTYYDFTIRGPLASMAYYPYPNNHVLHSLLTNFTRYLPVPALVALRFTPVLVTLLTNALCLHLMSKLYGEKMATVITALVSVLFFSLYYGYMSRGYYLVSLFFLICFYSAERIARGEDQSRHRKSLMLAAIAGFYTMPSFLYPFAMLCLYMVLRRPASLTRLIVPGTLVSVAVVLLYTPIIIVNGLSALIGNPYVKPIGRAEVMHELPRFLGSTLSEISGFHWIWTIMFLVLAFVHAVLYKQRGHLRDMAFFLAMPAITLLLHSVIPFPRTFCYYTLVLCLMALLPYGPHLASIGTGRITAVMLVVQVLLAANFFRVIRPYEERDPQVNMTAHDINRKIIGDQHYFCAGALMGTNLKFELETKHGLMDRVTFRDLPVNADTLTGYDHIIVGRLLDHTVNRKPEFSSPYFTVYSGASLPDTSSVKTLKPSMP